MDELIQTFISAHSSLGPILGKLSTGSEKHRNAKRGREVLHKYDEVDTLYGTVISNLQVKNESGDTISVRWINPFALIAHACTISLGFFRLMQACMQYAHTTNNGVMRFVLYQDGVTPGNNLRPDCGRSFISFLWSWMELPPWMRHRPHIRWLTSCYCTKRFMDDNNFTTMHLFKAILVFMFRNYDFNAFTGVMLRHGSEELLVRMVFQASPQDFLAHCEVFGLKGASSLSPCPLCDNVIGHRAYFEDNSGFVHVVSPMLGRCG